MLGSSRDDLATTAAAAAVATKTISAESAAEQDFRPACSNAIKGAVSAQMANCHRGNPCLLNATVHKALTLCLVLM